MTPVRITAALLAVIALARSAAAADATLAQIAPLLEDGTVAVVRLDLALQDAASLARLIPQSAARTPEQTTLIVTYADSIRSRLQGLGATRVYAILSSADLGRAGPFWLIPASEPAIARKIAAYLATGNPDSAEDPEAATLGVPLRVTIRDSVVFCGHAEAFDRLGRVLCPPRPDLQTAFAAAGDAPIAVAVAPSPAQRRVFREFWPAFPAESGQLAPEAASSIQWISLALDTGRNEARLQLATSSPADAAAIAAWAPAFLTWLDRQSTPDAPAADPLPANLLSVAGDRIDARIPLQNPVASRLLDRLCGGNFFAAEAFDAVHSLKQLGLAMHNFHDAWGSFPPPASVSKDGKPLLSWRVYLLPYLDQSPLYAKFHLDEPWDSPHNRPLIRQMPAVFASDAIDRNLEGKTTFLLPVADETPFHGKSGSHIRDIRDGTSNTVMILQASPEQAVPWTKPGDLPIDWKHLDKLFPASLKSFRAAFCDGSVHSHLNPKMPAETLQRILQHNDGQQVDTNTLQ